ncbi:unnamed protein product [Prunus armeniaca]|uniref:Uncharacterized protein n=1 Tax=Prunus armeniaca TaxID=36596 RepID=A0A6J5TF64_PRUAR|nr:unnamed protein product [Prunus armeniaca]
MAMAVAMVVCGGGDGDDAVNGYGGGDSGVMMELIVGEVVVVEVGVRVVVMVVGVVVRVAVGGSGCGDGGAGGGGCDDNDYGGGDSHDKMVVIEVMKSDLENKNNISIII